MDFKKEVEIIINEAMRRAQEHFTLRWKDIPAVRGAAQSAAAQIRLFIMEELDSYKPPESTTPFQCKKCHTHLDEEYVFAEKVLLCKECNDAETN